MRCVLLLTLLLVCSPNWAQIKTSDIDRSFGIWLSAQANYKFNKKWTFSIEKQYRLKDSLTSFDRLLIEIEASYNLLKQFELGLGSRYLWLNDDIGELKEFEHHVRFHLCISHKTRIGSLSLRNRFKYQQQNEIGKSRLYGDYTSRNYRWKSLIKYEIRNWRLDPEIATEFFYHSQLGQLSGLLGFKYRLMLGTRYRISKNRQIKFRLITEKELQIFNPQRNNFVEVKYSFPFKNRYL